MIDEDFCCRDHREKYFLSFRKAITQLPDLEIPVVTAAATSAPGDSVSESLASATLPDSQPPDPRVADFMLTAVGIGEGPESSRLAEPHALAACRAIEIPGAAATWIAALEHEQRPAELVEPIGISAAAIVPDTRLLAPMLATSVAIAPGVASLHGAGLAADDENGVPGEAAPCARAEMTSPAALRLVMPLHSGSMPGAAMPIQADFAELGLLCGQVDCATVAASEIALAQECHVPVFTASRESMQLDEADADAMAVPELAPALVMSSSPVGHTSSQTANSPIMIRPSLGLSSPGSPAQLSVPAMSSRTDAQPSLAPEAGVPDGQAANSAVGPRSHEAVRPTFWSSVRIKNWRLRITFAKPA